MNQHLFKPDQRFREVRIELTFACNAACFFCQEAVEDEKNIRGLSTAQWHTIIDKIAAEGIQSVRFTGGEPTLRKDILGLCGYARSKGLQVLLNTNAHAISRAQIAILGAVVSKVLISLHGFDKKSELTMSGRDVFKQKKTTIKRLSEKTEVLCDTLITQKNIRHFDAFSKLILDIGVKSWFFSPPTPYKGKMMFDRDDLKVLAEKIIKFRAETGLFVGISKCAALPLCATDNLAEALLPCCNTNHWRLCGGYETMVIDPFGVARTCYSLRENLGDMLTQSFADVTNNKVVQSYRKGDFLPDTCKTCVLLNRCGGGCRYTALAASIGQSTLHPLANPSSVNPDIVKVKGQLDIKLRNSGKNQITTPQGHSRQAKEQLH